MKSSNFDEQYSQRKKRKRCEKIGNREGIGEEIASNIPVATEPKISTPVQGLKSAVRRNRLKITESNTVVSNKLVQSRIVFSAGGVLKHSISKS